MCVCVCVCVCKVDEVFSQLCFKQHIYGGILVAFMYLSYLLTVLKSAIVIQKCPLHSQILLYIKKKKMFLTLAQLFVGHPNIEMYPIHPRNYISLCKSLRCSKGQTQMFCLHGCCVSQHN